MKNKLIIFSIIIIILVISSVILTGRHIYQQDDNNQLNNSQQYFNNYSNFVIKDNPNQNIKDISSTQSLGESEGDISSEKMPQNQVESKEATSISLSGQNDDSAPVEIQKVKIFEYVISDVYNVLGILPIKKGEDISKVIDIEDNGIFKKYFGNLLLGNVDKNIKEDFPCLIKFDNLVFILAPRVNDET